MIESIPFEASPIVSTKPIFMHPVNISDQPTFDQFCNDHAITISPLVHPDRLKELEAGRTVEVFYKSNSLDSTPFLAEILKNNGSVPTIPKSGLGAVSITVRRLR